MTYIPDIHRLLPQNPDAEKGILASIILAPYECIAICDDAGVDAEWFHIPANAEIWRAISRGVRRSKLAAIVYQSHNPFTRPEQARRRRRSGVYLGVIHICSYCKQLAILHQT